MEPPAAHRAQGVFVALAGVLAVSPDAMLLRWMRSLGASSPDVAVAKYIGIIAFMLTLGMARGVSGVLVSRASIKQGHKRDELRVWDPGDG